jgi:membrane protein
MDVLFLVRLVMFSAAWKMMKDTVLAIVNDEALSRGAAIAFYTVTSIAPILLIVIAIAGLAFGRDAAQNALTEQLSGLMGQQTAEVLQTTVASAASKSSGLVGDHYWNHHLDGDDLGSLRRNADGVKCDLEG